MQARQKESSRRLLPDNLLNESQASELAPSAGEIRETPHTPALGNWFNSLSARNETPPGSRGPSSHHPVRFSSYKKLASLWFHQVFQGVALRVTTTIFNDSVNDSRRRSSLQTSSQGSVRSLPAVQRFLTLRCSHLQFFMFVILFLSGRLAVSGGHLLLSLNVRERKGLNEQAAELF